MNARFLLLSVAICAGLSHSALAGFIIVNAPPMTTTSDARSVPTPMPPPPAMLPNGSFGTANYMDANMQVSAPVIINGFGRDIPLSIAVKQIVPAGIRVNFDNSVDTTMPVTWHGGKPWQDALSDAIRANGLIASVGMNSVTITATRTATPMPVAMPVMSTPLPAAIPVTTIPVTLQTITTSPAIKPMALEPIEIPTWTAKSSDTLHQTLEAWCKKAGVALRWDSEFDYPIETDVSLSGDFETSVRTLLRGLKNASPSPVARYYRAKEGIPGVLLVPSPSAADSHMTHSDTAAPTALPPAVMPAISNMPQGN